MSIATNFIEVIRAGNMPVLEDRCEQVAALFGFGNRVERRPMSAVNNLQFQPATLGSLVATSNIIGRL